MLVPINLRPELPVIDGRLLAELVEAYVTDARLRVAARTAGTYDYHLALLLEWWACAGPALGMRLDKRAWSLFEGWLCKRLSSQSGEPLTLLTRRSCLSRCKQMLRWAYRLGYLDRDFSDQVAQAKGSPVLRDALAINDLVRLMAAAGESLRPLRDQALVAVFVGTGVRRAEAAGLAVAPGATAATRHDRARRRAACALPHDHQSAPPAAMDHRCSGASLGQDRAQCAAAPTLGRAAGGSAARPGAEMRTVAGRGDHRGQRKQADRDEVIHERFPGLIGLVCRRAGRSEPGAAEHEAQSARRTACGRCAGQHSGRTTAPAGPALASVRRLFGTASDLG